LRGLSFLAPMGTTVSRFDRRKPPVSHFTCFVILHIIWPLHNNAQIPAVQRKSEFSSFEIFSGPCAATDVISFISMVWVRRYIFVSNDLTSGLNNYCVCKIKCVVELSILFLLRSGTTVGGSESISIN
jgi:hypothetical protein